MTKILGYCNNCAGKITADNIGSTVIAASGNWCNKPQCMRAAKRWQKRYIKQNTPYFQLNTQHSTEDKP